MQASHSNLVVQALLADRPRIRKVKCDEARPACHRCTSTGRICDGYGVWGGGSRPFQPHHLTTSLTRVPSPAYILEMGEEGVPYFEWFKCRTAIKLPASFRSGFWDQLVFQVVQSEPAVLYAVLALSCLHMDGHFDTCGYRKTICRARQGDRLVLQYYVKAIEHLQPHFNAQGDRSFRVTLMTCLIFACVDLLRSHFDTARSHVGNAIQLLRQAGLVVEHEDGNLHSKTDINQTDTWIIETCGRLQFQLELFTYSPQHSRSCLLFPTTLEQAFMSVNGAWLHLECIFKQIFQHGRDMYGSIQCRTTSFQQLSLLSEKEQSIQSELLRWQTKLEAFRETLPHPLTATAQKCFHLLQVYHTLATVMAKDYQKPPDQHTYDACAGKFALLLHQIVKLQEMCGSAMLRQQVRDRHLLNMSRTVIDLGSVAPLYYVAVNCRVPRIRSQALDVLESSTHREGFWDSGVSATVGRKLIEIEEKDFFGETTNGKQRDDDVPRITETCRVYEPEYVVTGSPMERILLYGKMSGGRRVLLSVYDVAGRSWADVDCRENIVNLVN